MPYAVCEHTVKGPRAGGSPIRCGMSAGETVALGGTVLEGRWRQWGFLRWKERYFVLDSLGSISLWKGETASGSADLVLQSAQATIDEDSETRFTLDDGSALYQLKAQDRGSRTAFVQALESTAGSAAVKARHIAKEYPERVGNYALGSLLGQGGFAKVRSGVNIETGDRIAAKIMKAEVARDPQHMKEIVAMGSLHHPNVVALKDIVYQERSAATPGRIFLILELATGGELFAKVVDAGHLSEDRARFYFRQLLAGVAYCHGKQLCVLLPPSSHPAGPAA